MLGRATRSNGGGDLQMGTNLASIVTETAERLPDGIAYKLDDTRSQLAGRGRGQRAGGGPAEGEGPRARRPRRDHAPERPVLPDRLLRHPARGRRGRADERAAEGPRGQVLPRGLRGQVAVRVARLRRGGREGRRGGGRRGHPRQARRVREAARRHRAGPRRRRPRRRRHRRLPLHVGHDRPAQGRRADPPQHDQQRDGVAEPVRHQRRRTSCWARCRCSTPSARPAA